MSNYSNKALNNAIETFYNTRNKIIVYSDTGANITASCEGTTLTATEIGNSGVWYFYYDNYGTWHINGTKGQYQGSDTVIINELKDYTVNLSISSTIDPILENSSWQEIQIIAQSSLGSSYWHIGDSKSITLNGSVRSLSFSSTVIDAFIIGFDHNSEVEGIGIHFQLGRIHTSNNSGRDICFDDVNYNKSSRQSPGFNANNYFVWSYDNGAATPRSGLYWNNGNVQQNILGQDINNPVGFLSCLPSSILNCIKKVTKYNTQGTSTNTLFLLSLFEVMAYVVGNYYIYQLQYDYYKNNSRIKYNYSSGLNQKNYFSRDLKTYSTGAVDVYIITESGQVDTVHDFYDECICPAFVIG